MSALFGIIGSISMEKVPLLDKMLCLTFCSYYKPGKNEELACRGYDVVKRLLQEGRKITFDRPDKAIPSAIIKMIVQQMCLTCDFHEHDCDFIQNRKAPPCGGFVLLAQLLGSGEIALDDIK